MFCKHCGKQIADDSTFCQYCGGNQRTLNLSTDNEHIDKIKPLNISAKVNVSNDKSLINRLINLITQHQRVSVVYALWFLVNLILLLCGSDHKGFFPRIFKDYQWWHEYTMPTSRAGYEKYSWAIEWKIENYGWVEFIVYIALLPLLVYVAYILYQKYILFASKKKLHLYPKGRLRQD